MNDTLPSLMVTGASGRMGRLLVSEILSSGECRLSGAVINPTSGSELQNSDAASLIGKPDCGVVLTTDSTLAIEKSDAVIDFSPASADYLSLCLQHKKAFICGSTNLDAETHSAIREAGAHIPVLYSANFSLGIALVSLLARKAAAFLGSDYDVEILEMHHRGKKDSPSGTALLLGHSAAGEQGDLPPDRSGPRPAKGVGYAVLRGGGVVGAHDVIFASPRERIILSHRADDRHLFAAGAVKAALRLLKERPGFYSLTDLFAPSLSDQA